MAESAQIGPSTNGVLIGGGGGGGSTGGYFTETVKMPEPDPIGLPAALDDLERGVVELRERFDWLGNKLNPLLVREPDATPEGATDPYQGSMTTIRVKRIYDDVRQLGNWVADIHSRLDL